MSISHGWPVSLFASFASASRAATTKSSTLLRQRCRFCLGYGSSTQTCFTSVRRLQTITAYRPHHLPSPSPPPPRNDPVLDTSIAGNDPQTGLSEAKELTDLNPRPRKSRLRPRKAAMTLSPAAVTQLRNMSSSDEPKLIRIGVKNRGCSGLAYHLEYVEKPGAFDETVEQDGVRVLIDSKALFSIIGSEMDWIQDKLNERFVFRNPNITEQCGCGESFSIS